MDDISDGQDGLGLASATPLTNRGSLTPKSRFTASKTPIVFKGFDYLRLTVWTDAENLRYLVENAVFERYCPEVSGTWSDQGPGRRIAERWTCAIKGLEVQQADGYAALLVKGAGCTALGLEALRAALWALQGLRWQATRLDLAWDGVPMTCREIFDHLKAGHVSTRSKLDPFPVGDLDAEPVGGKGATVYTHEKPEKRGIRRYARFYNMRGPVRCELVLRDESAAQLVRRMMLGNLDAVPGVALEALRGFIDLVQPGDGRVDRRPLLPAWAEFVGDAEHWRPRFEQERRDTEGLKILGLYELTMQRAARRLCELLDAYGPEYLLRRIEHHGRENVDPVAVDQLNAIRSAASNRGIAGVPAWPESCDADEDSAPF